MLTNDIVSFEQTGPWIIWKNMYWIPFLYRAVAPTFPFLVIWKEKKEKKKKKEEKKNDRKIGEFCNFSVLTRLTVVDLVLYISFIAWFLPC